MGDVVCKHGVQIIKIRGDEKIKKQKCRKIESRTAGEIFFWSLPVPLYTACGPVKIAVDMLGTGIRKEAKLVRQRLVSL